MGTTFKGLAVFEGCGISFDVILYGSKQSVSAGQTYDVEGIKDEHGKTVSRVARDEFIDLDVNMILTGDTKANAAKLNEVAPGGFLPPLQLVTVSDPAGGPALPGAFKGTFMMKSGAKINLKNTAAGDQSIQLDRPTDADQAATLMTTPA